MRKFKLLKDLPDVNQNEIGFLTTNGENKVCFRTTLSVNKIQWEERGSAEVFRSYDLNVVESMPYWFEEIKEGEPVIERWIDYLTDNSELADNRFFEIGNFKTREQAEEASERIKKVLMDYHKELGE